MATWGWILSDPWPGVYPRCPGEPAHAKGGTTLRNAGFQWLPGHTGASGLSNAAGERGHATRTHPANHLSSQTQPGKPRL